MIWQPVSRANSPGAVLTSRLLLLGMLATWPANPSRGDDALTSQIGRLTKEVLPQVVQWRRDIHAHPELSNQEVRTSALVADALRAMGVDEVKTGVARTGVVGLIRGKRPGPTVALRADMDALPVQEPKGLPFASQNAGVMHACGHDVHTSVLLGTARVLVQLRAQMQGNVKLIFQPAEECSSTGDLGGAALMVEQGALKNPDVAAVFGLHVDPAEPPGVVSYRAGGLMAAVDHFHVTIVGRQTHAGAPWLGVDPIVVSSHVVTALQTIRSRSTDTREPVVVSIGIIRGGTAWNIIPNEVELEGTVRTHDAQVRKQVEEQFRRIVEQTAAAHGATAKIDYRNGNPALCNDPGLAARMRPALVKAVGAERVLEAKPIMPGEDFARYLEHVPGLFFFLGVRSPEGGGGLHSPLFTVDEESLPVGIRAMAHLALDYLGSAGQ